MPLLSRLDSILFLAIIYPLLMVFKSRVALLFFVYIVVVVALILYPFSDFSRNECKRDKKTKFVYL